MRAVAGWRESMLTFASQANALAMPVASSSRATVRRLLHTSNRGTEQSLKVLLELRDRAWLGPILVRRITPDHKPRRTKGVREGDRRISIHSCESDVLSPRVVVRVHERPHFRVMSRLVLKAYRFQDRGVDLGCVHLGQRGC